LLWIKSYYVDIEYYAKLITPTLLNGSPPPKVTSQLEYIGTTARRWTQFRAFTQLWFAQWPLSTVRAKMSDATPSSETKEPYRRAAIISDAETKEYRQGIVVHLSDCPPDFQATFAQAREVRIRGSMRNLLLVDLYSCSAISYSAWPLRGRWYPR